ncbi:HEAT repeat domain-containing protein [Candidatus Woesearchaeota archaeon]|nr:HEAT repeat domain-containing protein [Candidatus Woesearchaeota archaeon]
MLIVGKGVVGDNVTVCLLFKKKSNTFLNKRRRDMRILFLCILVVMLPLAGCTILQHESEIAPPLPLDERVVPLLFGILNSEKGPDVKLAVAGALGRIDGEEVMLSFMEMLESNNAILREAAALGLGIIGNQKAVDVLIKKAKTTGEDEDVRIAAINALAKINGKKALDALVRIAKTSGEKKRVRIAAIKAIAKKLRKKKIRKKLSKKDIENATNAIIRILKTAGESPDVKKAAAEALGNIYGI